jgi:hypothetical protein
MTDSTNNSLEIAFDTKQHEFRDGLTGDEKIQGGLFDPIKPEPSSKQERVEQERHTLLESVAAGKLDTLQERVAWLLNTDPKTRDSDIALQVAFWETFESDLAGGDSIRKADLYNVTRLTSLARARAKIQNTYGLFQASPIIRRQRGKLSEEERAKAIEQQPPPDVLAVYADESGKTGRHLIVGSVWILHPPQIFSFMRRVDEWRKARDFTDEFHFNKITAAKLPHYLAFADFLVENAAVMSFKVISVERAGLADVDEALRTLYYQLLVRGIEQEDTTGRAPLPRGLQLWKDQDEPGHDKIFLARLKEELRAARTNRFDGRLVVEECEAIDSRGQVLIQVADLYTSSINRVLHAEGDRTRPKDQFADYLLSALGLPLGPTSPETVNDMTVYVSL